MNVAELLTVAETAERLNVTPATVRGWLYRRRLSRVRLGRIVRIPSTSIEEFIESGTVPARDDRR